MIRSIVVPLDGSDSAHDALPVALAIAGQHHAAVDLVHVHEGHGATRHEMADQQQNLAIELARSSGLIIDSTVLDGPAIPGLVQHIERSRADLVAMTTHGRDGIGRFWFGNIADELVRRCDVPVLAIKPRPSVPGAGDPAFHRILIPLDGSALGEGAIGTAVDLGTPGATSYVLLTVRDTPRPASDQPVDHLGLVGDVSAEDRQAHAYLERTATVMRATTEQRVTFHVVVHGAPAQAILDIANEHAVDLIALATHGRGGFDRVLLGSVAAAVLHGAQCSVLMRRPPRPSGTLIAAAMGQSSASPAPRS